MAHQVSLRPSRPLLWLVAVIAGGAAFTLVRQLVGHGDYMPDGRAFYCGGSALWHGHDPYVWDPARCENALAPGREIQGDPLPPFVVVLYALASVLPYRAFVLVYLVLAWLAIGVAAALLGRLTRFPAAAIALGLTPLLGYFSTSLGQPTPFVALSIVLAAYALRTERYVTAGISAATTLAYPQIGLPIVLAVFVCVPRARRALAASVTALGAAGLAVLGPAAHVHYVFDSLLGEQRRAALDGTHYGVAWLLEQYGVSIAIASALATVLYAGATVASILWLRSSARSAAMRPLVALLPPVVVCFGSSYVHLHHLGLALPFVAFALAALAPAGVLVWLGAAAAIVPWEECTSAASRADVARTAALVLCGIAFVRSASSGRTNAAPAVLLAATTAALFAIAALDVAILGNDPNVARTSGLATLSYKLPSLAGLAIVLAATLRRSAATQRLAMEPALAIEPVPAVASAPG